MEVGQLVYFSIFYVLTFVWGISIATRIPIFSNIFKLIVKGFNKMGFFSATKTPVEIKIDKETQRLLDITVKVKEKEMELESASLKMRNTKQAQEIALKEERHRHSLDMATATEKMKRERDNFTEDSERKIAQLESDHKIENDKIRTYLKLESDQKVSDLISEHKAELTKVLRENSESAAKINAENLTKLTAMKVATAEELSKVKSDLAKEYYSKMQDALKEITLHGTDQSNFVKELALEMMSKPVPATPAISELSVTTNSTPRKDKDA